MVVEITADPPDFEDVGRARMASTVAAAEAVLRKRYGATVRLADPENLGGSERSMVVRVRVAATPFSLPRTLVIKHYPPGDNTGRADPFAHEAASSQLLTALPIRDRISPELVGHDGTQRLLVLEDLGRSPTLADKLLGNDARAAERALLSWARAMGKLHASTAHRQADFDALIRRLGVSAWQDPVAPEARAALAELPELLETALGVATPAVVIERARGTARLLGGTMHRAFSPSDVCPDNSVVTSRGVRFLDFEWGCMRNVCLDAAALRIPFPSCWCAFALPAGMTEAMLAAWRSEAGAVWRDLDDDQVLLPKLFDAQLLWVWLSTWWFLPRMAEADQLMAIDHPSPKRSCALTARWRRLRLDAESAGLHAIAEHAGQVVSALVARFGTEALDLPLYPAFRQGVGGAG